MNAALYTTTLLDAKKQMDMYVKLSICTLGSYAQN